MAVANEPKHYGEEPVTTCKPVAIVGVSCFLPDANTPGEFWSNVLNSVNSTREIPVSRFDWKPYFSQNWKSGKIDSRWGCFLDPINFNPLLYGIPPKSLASISASQIVALEASRLALSDAGYANVVKNSNNMAVVIGASTTADLYHRFVADSLYNSQESPCVDCTPDEWTSDTYPGILVNVIAGRIANRFNCTGLNFTVDAACASSLAALRIGMQELRAGNSDLVIAGAVDLDQTLYSYQAFSSVRALSRTGKCRPFDQDADGTVLSEGAVIMVLKRLEDAARDGDKIYASIRSIESASDGRGMSLTAPNPQGQNLAITRAFLRAGLNPNRMTLYEAHGTGTVLGDKTELATLRSILSAAKEGSCTISATKGTLGHTKACAGMVGVLKMALSLYHDVLPPLAGIERPLPGLNDKSSPISYLQAPQPWVDPDGNAKIGGVSAFGFGGINYHAVMESAPISETRSNRITQTWPYELQNQEDAETSWVIADGRLKQRNGCRTNGATEIGSDTTPFPRPNPLVFPNDGSRVSSSPLEDSMPTIDIQGTSSDFAEFADETVAEMRGMRMQDTRFSELMELVICAIASVTGYPRASITSAANISADLGVDSLGRVEILELIQERGDPRTADWVDNHFDKLRLCETVSDLTSTIAEGLSRDQVGHEL
jgi:acyl transferase domain-containing protein